MENYIKHLLEWIFAPETPKDVNFKKYCPCLKY
jgi:hypothetical protein